MSTNHPPTPLIDERYREALQRFRQLERTLQQEREAIEREMTAILAARGSTERAAMVRAAEAPASAPRAHAAGASRAAIGDTVSEPEAREPPASVAQAVAKVTAPRVPPHVVIGRWGDRQCSQCGATLPDEDARRQVCSRCGSHLRFERAAGAGSPSKPFPCPACGKPLVGVGPGQPCYHCGHRLSRTIWSGARKQER
jgi:predicted RNA-binding Zn-ribbon protein involved in translation (DUF1610 family)